MFVCVCSRFQNFTTIFFLVFFSFLYVVPFLLLLSKKGGVIGGSRFSSAPYLFQNSTSQIQICIPVRRVNDYPLMLPRPLP